VILYLQSKLRTLNEGDWQR